jgi:hypothetical protein
VANTAGKFGPYPALALTAPLRGANTARLPVRQQTGAELIRSRIALQVRLGVLPPGERLPDTGVIAEELGMSEMTVRRVLAHGLQRPHWKTSTCSWNAAWWHAQRTNSPPPGTQACRPWSTK